MAKSSGKKRLVQGAWIFVRLVAFGAGLASVLGFAGKLWWGLDLLSHFRLQYLLILGAAAIPCALSRRWVALVAISTLFALNAYLVVPLYLMGPAAPAPDGLQLDIALFNVHHDNTRHDEVAAYLSQRNADVTIVLEATREWAQSLERAMPEQRVIGEWRDDAFGIAVLSRLPLHNPEIVHLADSWLPAVEAVIEKDGQRIALLAMHPPPPVSEELSHERDAIIGAAAEWAQGWSGKSDDPVDHVVIAGDMNATPWSLPLRYFSEKSGLVSSLTGFGVQNSWPRDLWPLRVAIDHVYHSPSLTAVERSLGPFMGSDHRPVLVSLVQAQAE